MWADNETERDFLNFSGIAETVAEIIAQANGKPVSIGVSGSWGVGKSSLIKLTHKSLKERSKAEDNRDFVIVEFNAWLYQGYDDARAALMDVIADKLAEEAHKTKEGDSESCGIHQADPVVALRSPCCSRRGGSGIWAATGRRHW